MEGRDMAIARVFECRGWTPSTYDQVIERMDIGGHSAPGVLFHWATETADGMRAVDVYRTREDADRVAADKVGPIAQELGLPMPEITEFEVHRYLEP